MPGPGSSGTASLSMPICSKRFAWMLLTTSFHLRLSWWIGFTGSRGLPLHDRSGGRHHHQKPPRVPGHQYQGWESGELPNAELLSLIRHTIPGMRIHLRLNTTSRKGHVESSRLVRELDIHNEGATEHVAQEPRAARCRHCAAPPRERSQLGLKRVRRVGEPCCQSVVGHPCARH